MTDWNMKRIRISISGRVQGVFFRASAAQEAKCLDLSGFARNEPDGSVMIEVQGDDPALQRFLEWARRGPKPAHVDDLGDETIPVLPDETDFIVVT